MDSFITYNNHRYFDCLESFMANDRTNYLLD